VPALLRKVHSLLNVYYSYQVFNETSPLLRLCDIEDPAFLSLQLLRLGISLKSMHVILHRLVREVPEFMSVVFLEPVADKRDSNHQFVMNQFRKALGDRPQMKERRRILFGQNLLEAYRARHQWNYLMTPVWEWLLDPDNKFLNLYESATAIFHANTVSHEALFLCGTSALEPLYNYLALSKENLEFFIKAGGLPCLVTGAVSGYESAS
jgi:hypothetical protein